MSKTFESELERCRMHAWLTFCLNELNDKDYDELVNSLEILEYKIHEVLKYKP